MEHDAWPGRPVLDRAGAAVGTVVAVRDPWLVVALGAGEQRRVPLRSAAAEDGAIALDHGADRVRSAPPDGDDDALVAHFFAPGDDVPAGTHELTPHDLVAGPGAGEPVVDPGLHGERGA